MDLLVLSTPRLHRRWLRDATTHGTRWQLHLRDVFISTLPELWKDAEACEVKQVHVPQFAGVDLRSLQKVLFKLRR